MKAAERPNVLFIISHDTGRHLPCYGRSFYAPNFSRFAKEGAIFDNYFCPAPVCGPSRGSIVTGRYPHTNSPDFRGFDRGRQQKSLPQYFVDDGYDTYLFGIYDESVNLQLLGYENVYPPGKERKPNTDGPSHRVRLIAPVVKDFISSYDEERPFFAWVGLFETHRPFHISHDNAGDADSAEVPGYLQVDPMVRGDIADLNGSVQALDEGVGLMLDALDASGLSDNTIVIYTTDHGIAFPRAKGSLYDPGLETSLIIRWPRAIKPGKAYHQLLCNVDLMPTLLDLAGIEKPDGIDGRSFSRLFRDENANIRDSFFSEVTWHCRYRPMRGLRTERYKYIRHFHRYPGVYLPYDVHTSPSGKVMRESLYKREYTDEELFDLEADPLERINLIGDERYRRIQDQMCGDLAEWMARTRDPVLEGTLPGKEHPLWEKEKESGDLPANQWQSPP